MRLLTIFWMCLICAAALSQQPTGPTTPPLLPDGGMQQGPQPAGPSGSGTIITRHSRVRAFNAGPDGQIRSVYLNDGTVVDVTGFGPGFGAQIRKGSRIRVTGAETIVNGQIIVTPQELTVGQQTFTPMPDQGPGSQAGAGPQANGQPPAEPNEPTMPPPPPPPPGDPAAAPPSRTDTSNR